MAGTIAGNGAKSNGKYVGVAPEASLYIAKVLRANGSGSMSTVMAGIEWAVLEQRVQIINLSLGGSVSCDGTDALSTLVDEAVRQAGVVVCVAAGNEGPEARTIGSPGCARYVITVVAHSAPSVALRVPSVGSEASTGSRGAEKIRCSPRGLAEFGSGVGGGFDAHSTET